MKKISQKLWHEIFKSLINLYGVVDSDDIYKVLNTYYPELEKDTLIVQMDKVFEMNKRDYQVVAIESRRKIYHPKYYLVNKNMNPYQMDNIISLSFDKPIYIASTLEEFLKYKDELYMDEQTDKYYTDLMYFLSEHTSEHMKSGEADSFFLTTYLYFEMRKEIQTEEIMDIIYGMGFAFNDEYDIRKLLMLLQNCHNHSRLFTNKGFRPIEMLEIEYMRHEKDVDKLINRIIKQFDDKEIDAKFYLQVLDMLPFDDIFKAKMKEAILNYAYEHLSNSKA